MSDPSMAAAMVALMRKTAIAASATAPATSVSTSGKNAKVLCEIGLGVYSMRIRRSRRVVSSFIRGGWMMGIRLMYE